MEEQLTTNEIDFCELFVNGGFEFSGDRNKCYKEAFNSDSKKLARQLMARPKIKQKIKDLMEEYKNNEENRAIAFKIQITDTLQKVMRETSTDIYATPKGHYLSPAPLRSVAVNASKALADIYVQKVTQTQKVQLEGAGDGGIIFNVIVPNAQPNETDTKETGK